MDRKPSVTPGRGRARTEIAWGVVDQGLSSATNLGMSILAGRLLGPSGLGVIFLGFSVYLLALSFVRALVTEPFVVATAARGADERTSTTRACMSLVLCSAIAISALMGVIGLLVPDPLGRSLLVFAPWTGVAILQDQWRSVLFRDQRGAAAACNDGVWAVGMIAMLPLAWAFPNDWSVAATWGVGAGLAAAVGFWQVRLLPSRLEQATRWWKRDLRRLGSWLAIENFLLAAGGQATVVVLAAELGAGDLGGLRAVEALFAPMTLLSAAFEFPGIPVVSRALASSVADARRWAWRLGFGALTLVGLYLAIVGPFREQVLSRVFGPEFVRFAPLVLPIALAQLIRAVSTGFSVFLKADRRVHAIVLCRSAAAITAIVLAPLLASVSGVLGAAWGLALASAIASVGTLVSGLLPNDISLRRSRLLSARAEP